MQIIYSFLNAKSRPDRNFLSICEITDAISKRANLIAEDPSCLKIPTNGETNPIVLAAMECLSNKSPIAVLRTSEEKIVFNKINQPMIIRTVSLRGINDTDVEYHRRYIEDLILSCKKINNM